MSTCTLPSAAAPSAGAAIAAAIAAYLEANPASVLLEDGRVLFEMAHTRHSLRESGAACTLHLWSETGNVVRRVVSVTPRGESLRLLVTRLGQRRPQTLELAPARVVRLSAERDERRHRGLRQLERVLRRAFPEEKPVGLRAGMDLEHSFGPAYVRGQLLRGRESIAFVAVGAGESQTAVDGVLSVALLWLDHCRAQTTPRVHVKGLRVVVPVGMAATTASRMRWLRDDVGRFELYTLDAREEILCPIDPGDGGNLLTGLVHTPSEAAARERFAGSIAEVLALLPGGCSVTGLVTESQPATPACASDEIPAAHRSSGARGLLCEVRLRSSAEVAFLCHGLEFARIRSGFAGGSFRRRDQITVGHGPAGTELSPDTAESLRAMIAELFLRRHSASPDLADPLARTQPERWLESVLRDNLDALDPALAPAPVYTQLPALTGAGVSLDRGLLDLLAVTRSGRLAILELKADEDLHLAMQGLDYWIRVREHHLTHIDPATGLGSLQRHGYFPATRLTPEPPHLFLVAPALHIHPATETLLRYLSPAVDWTLIALDERWRTRIKPVWVRRSGEQRATPRVQAHELERHV